MSDISVWADQPETIHADARQSPSLFVVVYLGAAVLAQTAWLGAIGYGLWRLTLG